MSCFIWSLTTSRYLFTKLLSQLFDLSLFNWHLCLTVLLIHFKSHLMINFILSLLILRIDIWYLFNLFFFIFRTANTTTATQILTWLSKSTHTLRNLGYFLLLILLFLILLCSSSCALLKCICSRLTICIWRILICLRFLLFQSYIFIFNRWHFNLCILVIL